MSRKDYELIARVFAHFRPAAEKHPEAQALHDALARELSACFKTDNLRFDRARFLIACFGGTK